MESFQAENEVSESVTLVITGSATGGLSVEVQPRDEIATKTEARIVGSADAADTLFQVKGRAVVERCSIRSRYGPISPGFIQVDREPKRQFGQF